MSDAHEDKREGVVLDAAGLPVLPDLQEALGHAQSQGSCSLGNLWGSSQGLLLASALSHPPMDGELTLVVTSTEAEAEAMAEDLRSFGQEAQQFPARQQRAKGGPSSDARSMRMRLQLVQALGRSAADRPRAVVSSLLALLQPVPPLKELESHFLHLAVGDALDPQPLLRSLVANGYTRQPLAEAPGEVSLRGDILDLFPFAADLPLRVEIFEDEIESVRTFDPESQLSVETLTSLEVCTAAESATLESGEGASLLGFLGPGAWIVEVEPLRVEEKAESLRNQSAAHERALRQFTSERADHPNLQLQSLPGEDRSLDTRSVKSLEVGMRQAAGALREAAASTGRVIVLCLNEAERHRLRETWADEVGMDSIELRIGSITRGFGVPALDLLLVGHHELKGMLGARRRTQPRSAHKVRAIQSFFELRPGDLVVHAVHGLARYRGLEKVERGGGHEEHLHLEFADRVSLFVPSSRIDMVQRYIGPGAAGLSLDRIGAGTFRKRKERVERGLFDMAAELLEVQAQRALRKRPSWEGDSELVDDLVQSFPYEDTPDQAEVDQSLAEDLYGDRPMDRLICGDVGFGKTELAVRAAFRVVNGGGQVAVLVPTTILSEQHFGTFRERMADFPVEVDVLSRYVTGADARNVVERVAAGSVDVLVGTHRILSKDVQWKNLGMVIIDEEQRFGVTHKEHFKQLRAEVDVLALTATPIPRTLHMSLSGLRDISALTVPPPGRQAIETVLGYGDDETLIREAILGELNRGGQVFFLHNRVRSIDGVAERLQNLIPSAVFAIGHGQMGAKELRAVMDAFESGEVNVLVATTIIENGLDIPLAGTILIDDADCFGLSELHQLRGRVGRGDQKAFCYLLVERHKPLKDIARERLKALEEFNKLGSGFEISVKDLELRGAGNILGAQQSGHIAAVGYDMFCRLLKSTVDRLEAGEGVGPETVRVEETEAGAELELGLEAYLPEDWIPGQSRRLDVLREISVLHEPAQVEAFGKSLRERYGRLPGPAKTLLRSIALKVRLDAFGLRSLAWRDGSYLITYTDPVAFTQLFEGRGLDLRRARRGVMHLFLPTEVQGPEAGLSWLESLLQQVPEAARMPVGDTQ
ncbi:MAG: transcription-repair coupling factor [bacterium]